MREYLKRKPICIDLEGEYMQVTENCINKQIEGGVMQNIDEIKRIL